MPQLTRMLASGSLATIAGRALREVLVSQTEHAASYVGWLRQVIEAGSAAGQPPEQVLATLESMRAMGLLPKPYQVDYALDLALSVTTHRESETEAGGQLQLSFFTLGVRRHDRERRGGVGTARLALRLVPIDPPEAVAALLRALAEAPPLPTLPR